MMRANMIGDWGWRSPAQDPAQDPAHLRKNEGNMKLFLISQGDDRAVVCSSDEDISYFLRPSPEKVDVRLIGYAAPGLNRCVVCASYDQAKGFGS